MTRSTPLARIALTLSLPLVAAVGCDPQPVEADDSGSSGATSSNSRAFAHVSRSVVTRLNTGVPSPESCGSVKK